MNDDADRRDAHLQAALRHAPDRDLAAPDAVSARILAQARAAVPARPAAPQPGWVERWFGWMSRPVAAGAFGTLLIAGFVGLMWRGGPPPEALPGADREAPVPVAAPAAVPPAAPQPAPPPMAAQAPAPAPAPAPLAEKPAAQIARMPATPPAERRAAKSESESRPAPTSPVTGAAREAPVGGSVADAAANKMAAPPASPPAPPPPAPAAAAAPAPAAAPALATQRPALRQRSDAAAFDPLVPALSVLAQSPGNPWQPRLQRLQQRLATPWVPGGAPPTEGGDTVTDAQGQRLGRLWLQGPVILWLDPDGNLWRATLRDE